MFDVYDNKFFVHKPDAKTVIEVLPPLTYLIKFNPMMGGFYLEAIDDFDMPVKIYGDVETFSSRALKTFLDRPATTGILLTGDKGSGKSLQAKHLCIEAANRYNIPTLVMNVPYSGDSFSEFLTYIKQPKIVFIDEFEKVYSGAPRMDSEDDADTSSQNGLLTLLDGVFSSQTLFLLTANDEWAINSYMFNRPGRIFYRLKYSGLTEEFVTLYCEDNLKDKNYLSDIQTLFSMISDFNFDILKALVEETNRWNVSPMESAKIMNINTSETDWVTDVYNSEGVVIKKGVGNFVSTGTNPKSVSVFSILFTERIKREKTDAEKDEDYFLDDDLSPQDRKNYVSKRIYIYPEKHYVGMKNKVMVFESEGYTFKVYAKKSYVGYDF